MPSILLPKLSSDEVRFEAGARWTENDFGDLRKLAAALHIPVEEAGGIPAKRVHALTLPSPWARLLLFDHAIRLPKLGRSEHPAQRQLLAEWRGLLGLIALHKYYGGKLKVIPASLPPGAIISRMTPSMGRSWDRFYIILWEDELVGSTSPLTVVFTGRRPLSTSIPFVDDTGRLGDPIPWLEAKALDRQSDEHTRQSHRHMLEALAWWINEVDSTIADKQPARGMFDDWDTQRKRIGEIMSDWLKDVEDVLKNNQWSRPTEGATLDDSMAPGSDYRGFLRALRVESGATESPFAAEADGTELDPTGAVLYDANGAEENRKIGVPGAQPVTFEQGKLVSSYRAPRGAKTASDVFEDTLLSVVVPEGAAAHAILMTPPRRPGQFYLFPVKAEILPLLGSNELDAVSADVVESQLRVAVRIRVGKGRTIEYRRSYGVANTKQAEIGDLLLWPDFAREDWKHYFWFTRDNKTTTRAELRLRLSPLAKEGLSVVSLGERTWGRVSTPPMHWLGACQAGKGLLGIRKLPEDHTPAGIGQPKSSWRVAVDFGSTKTVADYQPLRAELGKRQSFTVEFKPRVVPVFRNDSSVELDFFPADVPSGWDGFPTFLWMPSGSPGVVTEGSPWLPVFGLVYGGADPSGQWDKLREDLKWRPTGSEKDADIANLAFRNYLSSLYLMIAAEAAAQRGTVTEVLGSYPAALGATGGDDFRRALERAVLAVEGPGRNVTVSTPCTEDAALEFFMIGVKETPVDNGFMAVDVGGSTSDFVVILKKAGGGVVSHHASLRLAGGLLRQVVDRLGAGVSGRDGESVSDLCIDFIAACQALGVAQGIHQFTDGLHSPSFRSRTVDLFLRQIMSQDKLSVEFVSFLRGHKGGGRKALASVAFLYAAIAYYLGLLARPFDPKQLYKVHFAGRGSLLLDWLPGGRKDLPTHFFKAGLSAPNATLLPDSSDKRERKREVALGLLEYDPREETAQRTSRAIVAETTFRRLDSSPVEWDEPLTEELLRLLPPEVPIADDGRVALPMLEAFVEAWTAFASKSELKSALRIRSEVLSDSKFRSRLESALFGRTSSWKRAALSAADDEAIECEPLLITELKALLEYALNPSSPVNLF